MESRHSFYEAESREGKEAGVERGRWSWGCLPQNEGSENPCS